jgi:hydroxyacylglutathione hydrolase
MKIVLDMEDTFGDIVRKATRGRQTDAAGVASHTGITVARLNALLSDQAVPTEAEARAIATDLKLDPGKLADIGVSRWKPKTRELDPHLGHQVNAPHPSNGYFIILKEQRVAAFVDPGGRADNIAATLRRSPVALQYILVTHKHHDHIDALAQVRRDFPGARVVVHRLDAPALGDDARGALGIADGDTLPFGDGELRLIHTPGHTDGSSCFLFAGNIFTGDTLFAGSVGGLFGDRYGYQDLLANASTKIFSLPDGMVVFPGHGPPTTIGEERAHNPFF